MEFYTTTKKGNHINNEDFFIAKEIADYNVFAIADGVGGLPNGNIASKTAIDRLNETLSDAINSKFLFEDINQYIFNEGNKQDSLMGTTLITCVVNVKTFDSIISHVGDSRAYIINNDSNNFWRTKDHTLVQDLVELGIFNDDQAFHHPFKHRMKQALGTQKNIDVEINSKNLENKILLLCSDGLHDYVCDKDIVEIISEENPNNICESLSGKALENGSCDDITIIIANIGERKYNT